MSLLSHLRAYLFRIPLLGSPLEGRRRISQAALLLISARSVASSFSKAARSRASVEALDSSQPAAAHPGDVRRLVFYTCLYLSLVYCSFVLSLLFRCLEISAHPMAKIVLSMGCSSFCDRTRRNGVCSRHPFKY